MNKNGMPDEAQLTLTGAPELLGFSPTENRPKRRPSTNLSTQEQLDRLALRQI
jgi:hypothetical protein